jgi:hypothetical protein
LHLSEIFRIDKSQRYRANWWLPRPTCGSRLSFLSDENILEFDRDGRYKCTKCPGII